MIRWVDVGYQARGVIALGQVATGVVAVDVASGVESAPGRKDLEKVRAFVAAALGTGLAGG